MRLTLKTVPARQGAVWMRQGLVECLRFPVRYLTLFLCFMFVAALVMALPLVGIVMVVAAIPLVSLAFMMATVGSLRGQPPSPVVFIAPWQQLPAPRRRTLVTLCLAYALAMLGSLALCGLIDHGGLQALVVAMTSGADADTLEKLAQAPGVSTGILARVLIISLLSVPFWHAPGLVVWGEQGLAQSLFSSTLAMWRNKGAFLVYLASYLALTLAVTLLGGPLTVLLGNFAGLLLMPLSLLLTTAFYVSLFFTFRDSFGYDTASGDKDELSGP
ncbi:MAG TPA: BPSS1780 family membrane protein [Ideonella sp.]|uniref:BPSS1780 family membrane protein n=1 Tax=Ideonella sp. TaxID=1929293 RepID=UPI002C5F48E9|nr:BPSS1780 family membrane protein [Ideonella sp.]HSI49387.1 BPSS1780 family membrane protein [Ideonella sp.]